MAGDIKLVQPIDGIHTMLPANRMSAPARKVRRIYDRVAGARFPQREFGFFCLERWFAEGLPHNADLAAEFGFEPLGAHYLHELGWLEPGYCPLFEEKLLEDRGEHELVQDCAGRGVLQLKGCPPGYMPHFATHPVHDKASWEEHCKWRLDPLTTARYAGLEDRMTTARRAATRGEMISQCLCGGVMFLRCLMGPEEWLTKLYTDPELIHDCMATWLALADAVIARHQLYVTLDELFIAEDLCFKQGPLIRPDLVRAYFFPYYQQLISNIRRRQLDPQRTLHIQIDSDGHVAPILDLYGEIGMTMMSPFEVASGCDVVELGRQYPDLIMMGGIDKRVLAQGPAEIDAMVDRIFPAMQARGGYIPTCDHGVPEEVSLANYRHYRKRCLEFA